MEVEEIQSQPASSKFPRLSSDDVVSDENRLRGWHHHSSRIIRVSRASGGKDRHSKVWTSKGLRDRRVRLSVTTAIQFYDLQDRLGYDQPSKAVEWLIKAAAEAISELPSLSGSFPETPKNEMELDGGDRSFQVNPQASLSKSSSTSETSKGSGLSLSQSEVRVNRVKASRERARERAAKEKEKEDRIVNLNPVSNSSSSFTELLTGNGGGASSAAGSMDYFSSGLMGQRTQGFQLGNSIYNVAGDGQFSFIPDNIISGGGGSGGSDYNLNFTISGGFAGYNSRGTLQSNSSSAPSFLPHLQRFASSSIDGSNVPFFIGAAAPVENRHHHHHQHLQQQHHQFSAGFDGHKEKEKN